MEESKTIICTECGREVEDEGFASAFGYPLSKADATCEECGATLCEECAGKRWSEREADGHSRDYNSGSWSVVDLPFCIETSRRVCWRCIAPMEEQERPTIRDTGGLPLHRLSGFEPKRDDPADPVINIRRQWNDCRNAETNLSRLSGFHMSCVSGGVNATAPQSFLHAYVMCDELQGEIGHSCQHGPGPHRIKVCLVKTVNKAAWPAILAAHEAEKAKHGGA